MYTMQTAPRLLWMHSKCNLFRAMHEQYCRGVMWYSSDFCPLVGQYLPNANTSTFFSAHRSMSCGKSPIFALETVDIIAQYIPAFFIQSIFSRVVSNEPGLRNMSWVSRIPSRESWYFTQPCSRSFRHTSSLR